MLCELCKYTYFKTLKYLTDKGGWPSLQHKELRKLRVVQIYEKDMNNLFL